MLSAMLGACRLMCLMLVVALGLAACRPSGGCTGAYCGTLVFAAVGEPDILLPPSTQQAASRDIEEPLFLKLADIRHTTHTPRDEAFQPLIAARLAPDRPLTPAVHSHSPARWPDRQP